MQDVFSLINRQYRTVFGLAVSWESSLAKALDALKFDFIPQALNNLLSEAHIDLRSCAYRSGRSERELRHDMRREIPARLTSLRDLITALKRYIC